MYLVKSVFSASAPNLGGIVASIIKISFKSTSSPLKSNPESSNVKDIFEEPKSIVPADPAFSTYVTSINAPNSGTLPKYPFPKIKSIPPDNPVLTITPSTSSPAIS